MSVLFVHKCRVAKFCFVVPSEMACCFHQPRKLVLPSATLGCVALEQGGVQVAPSADAAVNEEQGYIEGISHLLTTSPIYRAQLTWTAGCVSGSVQEGR
jgi:hypothetical protein